MDLKRMDEVFKNVIKRSNNPIMSAAEAAEALGTTPEAIIRAAEGNHLPFGFMTSEPGARRRSVLISRKKLNDWWEGRQ